MWVYEESHADLSHNIIAYHSSTNVSAGVDSTGNEGESPAAVVTLIRNCLWDNKMDYIGEMDHGSDLLFDPCFAVPENGNYHLLPNSPCIGAGVDGEDLGALTYIPPR